MPPERWRFSFNSMGSSGSTTVRKNATKRAFLTPQTVPRNSGHAERGIAIYWRVASARFHRPPQPPTSCWWLFKASAAKNQGMLREFSVIRVRTRSVMYRHVPDESVLPLQECSPHSGPCRKPPSAVWVSQSRGRNRTPCVWD